MTLMSVAVGYLGAAAAVWASLGERMPDYLVPLLPIPPVLALCYHLLLNALVFARTASAMRLEQEIAERVSLPSSLRGTLGMRAGDAVMNPQMAFHSRSRWPFALLTGLPYLGVYGIAVAFTFGCLKGSTLTGWHLFLASLPYTLVGCLLMWGWSSAVLFVDHANLEKWWTADYPSESGSDRASGSGLAPEGTAQGSVTPDL